MIELSALGGQLMKLRIALILSMAFCIPGALAQNVQYNVELPKRQGNLKHYFTYPPSIDILPTGPFVNDHRNTDADNRIGIIVGPVSSPPPSQMLISVPGKSYPEAGSPTTVHTAPSSGQPVGFQSNILPGSHPLLPLPAGQTSRVL